MSCPGYMTRQSVDLVYKGWGPEGSVCPGVLISQS